MEITVYKMGALFIVLLNQFNRKFTVDSKLALNMENGKLTYSVVPVQPYEKELPVDDVDAYSFLNSDEKAVFFANVDGEFAGQIKVISWWNHFAYIDNLVVAPEFRRQGVGRALIEKTITWAKEKGFPGLMLETQDNNVPACRLYESCGFELCGFDQNLYKDLHLGTDEIALYWYLIF